MKVFIQTFGCQMNRLDTALVTSALKKADFTLTDTLDEADIVLINTCSVRRHAEEKVISHLGHLKHIKETRPNLVVGIIGCMAQRLGNKLLEHQAVDIVCGPAQIHQITGLLTSTLKKKKKIVSVTKKIRQPAPDNEAQLLEEFECVYDSDDRQLPSQAYVRAMHGCDNFCSYCIVPYVRGPQACRPPKLIIEQIKKLAAVGIKQITLLGQRVNAYKYIQGEKTYCLADLLEMASAIDGIEWIKFVTSYPAEEFFDEICSAMSNLPKVCHYLHIPAQSGSDKILKVMNRHYTAAQYLELLDRARNIVPDIAIAGDFIVGFPGETDEDFQASIDLARKARYKNAFIFKYSPRPGTTAENRLPDNVPIEVKQQRNCELLKVQEKISDQLSNEFIGQTIKVLVEGLSKKPHLNIKDGENHPQLTSRTAGDWIVVFNGPSSLAGRFATVKITKTTPLTLFGELLS